MPPDRPPAHPALRRLGLWFASLAAACAAPGTELQPSTDDFAFLEVDLRG